MSVASLPTAGYRRTPQGSSLLTFNCGCQQVCTLQKQGAGEDEVRESLVAHRRLLDGLASGPAAGWHGVLADVATVFLYLFSISSLILVHRAVTMPNICVIHAQT